MWQAPNQRSRSQKRGTGRNRLAIHLIRSGGAITVPADQTTPKKDVRILLNDFSIKGVGIFSSELLQARQEIELTIDEPKLITIKGRIAWSQEPISGSHILTEKSFRYRAGVEFLPKTPEEEAAIKAFVDELTKLGVTISTAA